MRRPDAPTPVSEASCAHVGATLHTILGFESYTGGALRATAAHYVLDLDTGLWTRKADAPFAGSHAQPTSNGTHIFLAGGFVGDYPGTLSANAYAYSIAADAWMQLPSLPRATGAGGLAYENQKLYYFSGLYNGETSSADIYSLDLTDGAATWQTLPQQFPDPRNHIFAVRVRPDYIVLAGGAHGNDNPTDLDSSYSFFASNASFGQLAVMPQARSHYDAVAANGRLIVAGGRNVNAAQSILADVIEYSPDDDDWFVLGNLPAQRMSPCIALHRNDSGSWLFLAKGGTDWNQILAETYVSPVTVACNYTEPTTAPPPTAAPTDAPTDAPTTATATPAPSPATTSAVTTGASPTAAPTPSPITVTTGGNNGGSPTTGKTNPSSAYSLPIGYCGVRDSLVMQPQTWPRSAPPARCPARSSWCSSPCWPLCSCYNLYYRSRAHPPPRAQVESLGQHRAGGLALGRRVGRCACSRERGTGVDDALAACDGAGGD